MSLSQVAIAFDQLANAALGGYADETLSARAWRTQSRLYRVIDAIFFWHSQHCFRSFVSEFERHQLPTIYRTAGATDAND